tara:strand:- start:3739 stop:4998 length:1260 start_codon:yes stop_codon:yes gene_type:complete
MSRFTFNFYNDIRKPLKSGLYSIKVWLYDKAAKKGINFTIKKVAGVEVSCSKDDWINIWENKDRKNSFNEVIGETTVYGRKLEVRVILKAKQDILEQLILDPAIIELSDIKNAFHNYTPKSNFKDDIFNAFDSYANQLNSKGSYKTSKGYTTTARNIFKYTDGKILRFSDITINWLETYERIRLKSVSKATVGIELRNLRTIFNEAIIGNASLSEHYPFGRGKYQIPKGGSKNTALTKEQLKKILEFKSKNHYLQMARDYFLFSYYANGMNLKDIAKLKQGQTEWVRSKTEFTSKNEKRLSIDFNDEMLAIVKRHKGRGRMLFNIVEYNDDNKTISKKVDNKISSIAKQIKKLAKVLDLPVGLSFQWARHSYATNVYRAGVNLKAISETLGHNSLATTENYLDSLSDENKKAINDAKEL